MNLVRRLNGSVLRASRGLGTRLQPIIVFVLVIALWEAVVAVFDVSPLLLPAPSKIGNSLFQGVMRGYLINDFKTTLVEALVGYAIGASLGIAIGACVAELRAFERLLYPYVVALQAVPKMAIAPLVVIWLGFGISSKIAVVAMIVIFPVIVNTAEGLKSAELGRIEMLRSFGASRWQIFRMVKIPSSLPYIFAGLDIAAVLAILGAVVAEWVGASAGLGNLILRLTYSLDIKAMFGVLVLLSLMGVGAHLLVQFIHRRVVFWQ